MIIYLCFIQKQLNDEDRMRDIIQFRISLRIFPYSESSFENQISASMLAHDDKYLFISLFFFSIQE